MGTDTQSAVTLCGNSTLYRYTDTQSAVYAAVVPYAQWESFFIWLNSHNFVELHTHKHAIHIHVHVASYSVLVRGPHNIACASALVCSLGKWAQASPYCKNRWHCYIATSQILITERQ